MRMLDRIAEERGVLAVGVAFTDTNGNAVVPTSASWKLTDVEGNVINGRSNVSITIGGLSSTTIVLQGLDLAVGGGLERAELVERRLQVTWTYTGLGTTLVPKSVVGFKIRNGAGV